MVYHEKEIKLKVNNYESLINSLRKCKAKNLGSAFERTIRFEKNNHGLENEGLFLRVRSGFKNIITLKEKVENGNVHERKEFETEIGNVEIVREIINKLGFSKEMIMEKYRSKYNLEKTELCIDELPFGLFVEIEGNEKDIFETVKKLGLNEDDKILVTYWDLFEEYKKNTGKDLGENITFPKDYKQKTKLKNLD